MADLKTVLTETLAQQLRCSGVLPPSDETYRTYETKIWHLAQDFADAILGLSGVAVTQLPERETDAEWGDTSWPVPLSTEKQAGKLLIDPDWRAGPRIASVGIPTPIAVADAPGLAAALLAAAAGVFSEGATQ